MDTAHTQIRKVTGSGAGKKGIRVPTASAADGYEAIVKDDNVVILAKTRKELAIIVENGIAQGKAADSSGRKATDAINFTIHSESIAEADSIIEAVPERFEVKRAVFAKTDARAHVSHSKIPSPSVAKQKG